jgi:SAM-dependent methyltransferase
VSCEFFRAIAREAAEGYPRRDLFARHFGYGKLTGDPAFAHLLRAGLVPGAARVLDLGCGQALVAALLVAARKRYERGGWPGDWPMPPAIAAFTGIELRERDVERARKVNWAPDRSLHEQTPGATMRFIAGDIRTTEFPHADVVVILDVLHYIDYSEQAEVLGRVRAALSRGGILLLRVGDESPTLRFRYTLFIDRISTGLRGLRLPRLWCRPVAAWRAELEKLGFAVRAEPMSEGTAFANVLLTARYDGAR